MIGESNINEYIELKRRIYLVIFPILFIVNAFYWLFSNYVDSYMKIFIPILCLLIAIVCVFFYINRLMYMSELIILIAFGLYHLNRVQLIAEQLDNEIINIYVMWSPFYFIYIFMVLEKKWALVYSLFIYCISVAIGSPHFDNVRATDSFIQYYTSTVIFILILFFFKKIIGTFIESDLLRKYAYYDTLTNIGNRRSVDTYLEDVIKRCQETNDSFSIIYFDIDHFKHINDTYGHDIGDYVLKEFTSVVKSTINSNEFFGRWGGEEFIIITKNSLTEAVELAETIRKIIEKHSFNYVNYVTTSFGVSSYCLNDTPKTLIKRADQALYMAKNSGRNMVKAR